VKVKLFTKSSNAEVRAQVKMALRDLRSQRVEPEVVDVDTPEGATDQELYGVVTYPTVVVVTDDGREVASWHGQVPRAEDIRYALGHI
jgi:HEAT repeat protein